MSKATYRPPVAEVTEVLMTHEEFIEALEASRLKALAEEASDAKSEA